MSFDFDAAVSAPHRMQPGLRRLAPGVAQLTPAQGNAGPPQVSLTPSGGGRLEPASGPTNLPNRGQARHLREKLAVLGAFPSQALLVMPGFDARPALQALAAHAAAEQPQALRIDGDTWHAPWLGWAVDEAEQPRDTGTGWPEIGPLLAGLPPPWRRAALLSLAFAEDFAVLDGASGTLPWLAVALPSMWAPEEKIGRHFTEVHAPVADNRLIIGAAQHLIRLVTEAKAAPAAATGAATEPANPTAAPAGAERWERFVWTLSAHPRLHAHPQRVDPARWPPGLEGEALAAQTWWRTERQTFIPVPAAPGVPPQAVFTILVNVRPLAQALLQPAQAAQVHDALASMSEAVLHYRGLAAVRAPLLHWLARRAAVGKHAPANGSAGAA